MYVNLYHQAITTGKTKEFYYGLGAYRNNSFYGFHNRVQNYLMVFEYGREYGYDVMFEQVTSDFVKILKVQDVDSHEFFLLYDLLNQYINISGIKGNEDMPKWNFDVRLIELFMSNYERLKVLEDMTFVVILDHKLECLEGKKVLPFAYEDLLLSKVDVCDLKKAFECHDGKAFIEFVNTYKNAKPSNKEDIPIYGMYISDWKEGFVYYMFEIVREGIVCTDDVNATFQNIEFCDDNVMLVINILVEYINFYKLSAEHRILKIKTKPLREKIKMLSSNGYFSDCGGVSYNVDHIYSDLNS